MAVTLDPQENGELKFLGGLVLTARDDAVKRQDKFFTYTPLKDNSGFDGVWVTRESGQTLALIISQAGKPDPEMAMISAGNFTPELDTNWEAVKGHRIDGDLNILSVSDGLTAARFDDWRTRETLTLNSDGTLFLTSSINNDSVYIRVKADQ